MSEKKDKKARGQQSEFKFNTLVQGLADKIIKPALPAALNRLEQNNRTLWLNGAWLYQKAPAEIREAFEGMLRLGVLGIEWAVDAIRLPHVINDALEFIAVRVLSQVPDYYKQTENRQKLEAEKDFQPLTLEQAKEVGKEFAKVLMSELRDPIKRINWFSNASPVAKLGSPARLIQNLLHGLDDPEHGEDLMENLWVFMHDWLIRDDDRENGPWYEKWRPMTATEKEHWFKQLAPYLDETGEQRPFFACELPEQVLIFKIGIIMKKKELWPAIRKFAEEFWSDFEAVAHNSFIDFERIVIIAVEELRHSNRQRKEQIRADRFSVPNLVKYTWRIELLWAKDPNDPRLLEVEAVLEQRKVRILKPSSWLKLRPVYAVTGIVTAVLITVAIIGFIMQFRNEPPQVSIWHPTGGTFTEAPTITGQAQDDNEVVMIEVQSNNGPRHQLFVLPAYRVNFTWTPDVVQSGQNSTNIWMTDSKNAVRMSEVKFWIETPTIRQIGSETFPVDTIVPGIGG